METQKTPLNKFMAEAKASQKVEDTPVVEKEVENNSEPSGRKILDEQNITDTKYLGVPNSEQIGESTPEMVIVSYFMQPGREAFNAETKERFWTGMTKSDGEEIEEFVLEVKVDGEIAQMRLPSWELVYKMDYLRRYLKNNNFTLAGQKIQFKRVRTGKKNAGKNWEVLLLGLKKKIIGSENGKGSEIVEL